MTSLKSSSYDYLVIGGGSGGISSARRSATYGARAAVVERGRMGGTCVNVGCVPKKVMWNAAMVAEILHDMENYGFGKGEEAVGTFSWKFLKERRDAYVKRLNGIYDTNLGNSAVDKLEGVASLSGGSPGAWKVKVTGPDGSENTVTAKNVLLAPGGYPDFPPGDGVRENSISSDGFFDLEELPEKSVVVGAGYIAVELAGVLNALGSDVTLVLRRDKALREFDDIVRDTLDKEMVRQGITILRDTGGVSSITASGDKKTVHLASGDVSTVSDVDCVLMATGRKPLVEPLNLPSVGISQSSSGHIEVNEYSETNAKGIFALGDVCGNVELTPMAIAAGRRLADRLFGGVPGAKTSYEAVPTIVFSHPPIGTIGYTEQQAKDVYGEENVKVYTSKFANLYYGVFDIPFSDKPPTAMKLVTYGPTEIVVGVHCIGMGVDEMMQGFGVAVKMGATKADFDSCIAIHPTASEELVTMAPWGLGPQETGAKESPLNGANTLPKGKVESKL
jgi:glutathione reductase (NADPH)